VPTTATQILPDASPHRSVAYRTDPR